MSKPIMEQAACIDAVERIRALCKLLGLERKLGEPGRDGRWSLDYDCRSERSVSFGPDGSAVLTTWETSGHNGDPYGEEDRALGWEEGLKELQGIVNGLEARALDAERKRLSEARERRRTAAAMKSLNARLKSHGG